MNWSRLSFLKRTSTQRISSRAFLIPFGIGLSILIYTYLIVAARSQFAPGRILGWDTLVYLFSAEQTIVQGVGWLVNYWGHPNPYVLALSGFTILLGDLGQNINLTSIGLVAALSASAGYLTLRIGNPGAAFLAAGLTATSFATFRLSVDLHRALFAFILVTILLALEYRRSLSKAKLDGRGILALAVLILMAFSEFEIYLAFLAAAFLVTILSKREHRWYFHLLWSLLPALLFALTPKFWGTLSSLTSAAPGLNVESLPPDLALLYLSTIAVVPFAVIGVVVLARSHESDAAGSDLMLLSWVAILLLILVVYSLGLNKIEIYRPLILIHVPILAAIGLERTVRALSEAVPRSEKMRIGGLLWKDLQKPVRRVVFALLATSLLLLTGIQLIQNSDRFLRPVVEEELYERLVQSSGFLDTGDWPAPIYLVSNISRFQSLTAIRYQLGVLHGPSYFSYGDLNFVPWTVSPLRIGPDKSADHAQFVNVFYEFRQMKRGLDPGPLDAPAHPIIIIQPDLFDRSLPTEFERFHVDDGIYVIPPNALSIETFYVWELLPAEDSYGLGAAYLAERNWSLSPKVVEIYTRVGYQISFPYYFPVSGTYEIAVHLFDFPATDPNTTVPLSPLELMIDDVTVNTLFYSGQQVIWWNTTVDVQAGFDVVTLRAASETSPFRLSLDTVWIAVAP